MVGNLPRNPSRHGMNEYFKHIRNSSTHVLLSVFYSSYYRIVRVVSLREYCTSTIVYLLRHDQFTLLYSYSFDEDDGGSLLFLDDDEELVDDGRFLDLELGSW